MMGDAPLFSYRPRVRAHDGGFDGVARVGENPLLLQGLVYLVGHGSRLAARHRHKKFAKRERPLHRSSISWSLQVTYQPTAKLWPCVAGFQILVTHRLIVGDGHH